MNNYAKKIPQLDREIANCSNKIQYKGFPMLDYKI